ncbi:MULTISPECIES: cupin domain-containing protein [unclassified Modestobacter]|uniref:cupin domain-containing protein n=1 Tax=unclassified Modestobacter TaxID=2643866 RepID=UPI0022AA15A1|nr:MULTISPECIES: cupin domain-containing protein [unclassified Modestobacter]MCZ2826503.1 cupin domain-containing protein [Modestobacter sp. VKM Ac-2981]MCZ2852432.1 cupin domain-containing protein [Modestobacter sp. VKM Ac-2982]
MNGERQDVWGMTRDLAAAAADAHSGRAAHTVHGGHEATLRQTVIALRGGTGLAEHENPGEATLLVLEGRVRLTSTAAPQELGKGELLAVPAERHALEALEDSVVLLTVAKLPA